MQGKKNYQEKLFVNFQLSNYVPIDNIYRQLKEILNLNFLYKSTSPYYGSEGQKSVDPVVFMKLMLVGYLENLNSDRRIINVSRMRMDIRYFLGYDLDEELPWHSTLSRTRKLYGEEQFITLFKQVLKLCIDEGLVTGRRQAIDSALIRANASIDKMVEKQVMDDADAFTKELESNNENDTIVVPSEPEDKAKVDDDKKLSNATHYSPADPDARLILKPGKPYDLYYRSQVSVDTSSHFITYIRAFHGNKADCSSLPVILKHLTENMLDNNIHVKEILADTGYSSGEALQTLINQGITGFIPSSKKNEPQARNSDFIYDPENDWYTCTMGVHLIYRRTDIADKKIHIRKKVYQSTARECKNCPLRDTCVSKKGFKKMTRSIDRHLYEEMDERMKSVLGKQLKKLRSSTIEPVLGSLINYTGMKRIYTKGIKQANKCMLMAAVAYNLKKFIKYKLQQIPRKVQKPQNDLKVAVNSFLIHVRYTLLEDYAFSSKLLSISPIGY